MPRHICGHLRGELAIDARYATHTERGRHQLELDGRIAQWTATIDAAPLHELLLTHSIPTGRIYRAPEMLADPHFSAREAIVRVPHAVFGELPMHGVFPKLSHTPGSVRWAGPELGQHNVEVLQGILGRDDAAMGDVISDLKFEI